VCLSVCVCRKNRKVMFMYFYMLWAVFIARHWQCPGSPLQLRSPAGPCWCPLLETTGHFICWLPNCPFTWRPFSTLTWKACEFHRPQTFFCCLFV
jgi:hypothetical protein